MSYIDALGGFMAAWWVERNATIEEACEMALQDGRFGVLVREGFVDGKMVVEAGPDPSVPYGLIHLHPLPTAP